MGLLNAATTVVRLVASPSARVDRERLAREVGRRAFRALDGEAGTADACGWVPAHDPLATDFGPADLFLQQYLVVGFRFDRRTIPAKLLFLERRRAEAEVRAERGLDRLGRAVRAEIKEEVRTRLMVRALPVPRVFDCVWNLDTGHVLFTGKHRAAREAFVDLFWKTFGVRPVPMIPYLAAEHMGLSTGMVDAVRAVAPATLIAGDDGVGAPRDVPRVPFGEEARP